MHRAFSSLGAVECKREHTGMTEKRVRNLPENVEPSERRRTLGTSPASNGGVTI